MNLVDSVLCEMIEDEFLSLDENKDSLIDRLDFLDMDQKGEMKDFFRKRPNLENSFDWNKPNDITWDSFRELKDKYPDKTDPDTVPEFTDKRDEGDGIVSYAVKNDKDGMFAVRKVVDTHWGTDKNPWCLISRDPQQTYEQFCNYVRKCIARNKNFVWNEDLSLAEYFFDNVDYQDREKFYNDPALLNDIVEGYLKSSYAKSDLERENKKRASMERGWNWWQEYPGAKRIAFKNRKLLAFGVKKYNTLNWYDFHDVSAFDLHHILPHV